MLVACTVLRSSARGAHLPRALAALPRAHLLRTRPVSALTQRTCSLAKHFDIDGGLAMIVKQRSRPGEVTWRAYLHVRSS